MAGALIGALRVSLSAETSAFEQGMKRAQRAANKSAGYIRGQFGGIGASLKSSLAGLVGAVTIGTVVAAGKAALEYAGSLGELASTLGITTKDLQTFSYAAGQVGISQEELEVGIQKLTISMGKAQLGSQAQVKAFNAIGISIDQLKGKNTGEVFRLIAERLEKVSDRSARAAVEVALFGRAGAKLDNLLSGSEGRLDDLSRAAEELGIVLSDEQIQKADKTADRIAALQTVLKAKIAGAVADNSDAILDFADSLAQLAGDLARVLGELARFANGVEKYGGPVRDFFRSISDPRNSIPARLGLINPGRTVSAPLSDAIIKGGRPIAPVGGGGVTPFLGGGGGRKGRADHTAEETARRLYQFQQDELRAQEDILQAKKDLAGTYEDEMALETAILDLQRKQYKAQLGEDVRQKDKTRPQAANLLLLYDQSDALKREKLAQEHSAKQAEDMAMLEQADFDRQRDILEKRSDLAETQAERRKIELELLRLAYQEKRAALQHIVDTSKNQAEIANARRDLEQLNATYNLDKRGVLRSTAGPMESYLNSLPHTAAQMNEALQALQVQGLEGLVDALSHVGEGWQAMRDIALQTIQDILSALIRLQLQKMLFGILGQAASFGSVAIGGAGSVGSAAAGIGGGLGAFGGLPGFASGGSGVFRGLPGIDRNILSLNGSPIARVSRGEAFNIGNDNGMAGGITVNAPITIQGNADRDTVDQIANRIRQRVATVSAKGY